MASSLVMALFALALTIIGSVASPTRAAAAGCTAAPVTDPMAITLTPNTQVQAWQMLKASFSGSISDGHCAGDSFSFDIPDPLSAAAGTYPLKNAAGDTVATMVIANGTVTVTLTSFVETHQNVSIEGWLTVQTTDRLVESGTQPITWTVNGHTSQTPVEVKPCPGCSQLPTWFGKWGYVSDDGQLLITLQLPVATKNQTVEWTDELTSPGQHFVCPVTPEASFYTEVNAWGTPTNRAWNNDAVTVTSCTSTKVSGTVQVTSGTVQQIVLPVTAEVSSYPVFTDQASATVNGQQQQINYTYVVANAGGSGDGDTPVSPSPSQTVPASPSEASPSEASPSEASPSESPSPSPVTLSPVNSDSASPVPSSPVASPSSNPASPSGTLSPLGSPSSVDTGSSPPATVTTITGGGTGSGDLPDTGDQLATTAALVLLALAAIGFTTAARSRLSR